MKTCQEKIKPDRPDRVLEPVEERAAARTEQVEVNEEKDQEQVPEGDEDRDRDKARAEVRVKAGEEIDKEVNIMPGFDKTGPQGAGPMTGGRRGFCNPTASDFQPVYGRGFGYGAQRGGRLGSGRGFRGARGRGWQFASGDAGYPPTDAPLSTSENRNILIDLKQGVDTLNRLLNELKDHIKTPGE